jgi:hypothetical protein
MNKRWLVYSGVLTMLSWFLFSGIGRYPYPANGEFSDYAITHLPNLLYTQNSIETWAEVPLWNTAILSGNPYAADPLSSLWYPPYWLAVLLPAPYGLNILTIIHVAAGGLGIAFLAEALGYRRLAAYAAGIVFVLMPKLYAHLGAGHITLIWAVCLTPWLLFLEHRSSHATSSFFSRFLPALAAGWILLADVRWGVWSWLLWWSFAFSQVLMAVKSKRSKPGTILRHGLFLKAKQSAAAILIAAPLQLPLLQFIRLSTRNSLTPADSLVLSLPPESFFGLVFPNFGGSAEWITYFGLVPVTLLLVVVAEKRLRSKAAFWIIWFVLSLLISLGEFLPGAEWIASLPVVSLLRVPPRALFLAGICLAIITARAIQDLPMVIEGNEKKPVRLVITGFIALSIVLGILFSMNAENPAGFIWGAVFSSLGGGVILLLSYRKISFRAGCIILSIFLITDLGFTSHSMLRFDEVPVGMNETIEVIKASITGQDNPGRVYSPSYSIPQEIAALSGIRLAGGVDPLHLAAYSAYMADATGVKPAGYSVTVPAFKTGNPAMDNRDANLNDDMLGFLNVTYVASAFPLENSGLELIQANKDIYVYQNTKAFPAAWVQEGNELGARIEDKPARMVQYSPNLVSIQAEGPGTLVLADPMYPGWTAWVDGKKATITVVGGLLRGVALVSGSHAVEFRFRSTLLYIGFACQFLVLIWVIFNILLKRRAAE